ncbi:MAG: molecular chaperone, small heat shock protein [halophilic archaeon J07HX5]|jgi:Molecular chaperone (small heat shock protein)|nr:MAG: molecular chaperone, small heat shock protein [halophilic archaeon J07HX5]
MSELRAAVGDLPEAVFADVLESEEAYLVVLDLPGATAETVDVRVEDGRLVIEARREKAIPPAFRYVNEGRSLFLDVELPLPADTAGHAAEADLAHGVLELRLPKQADAAETNIPIDKP